MKLQFLALSAILATVIPQSLLAADLNRIHTSADALVEVVEDTLRPAFVQESYLPGYGYHIAAEPAEEVEDAEIQTLREQLRKAAPTIEGLDAEDWVSISSTCCLIGRTQEIILRIKPNGQETAMQYWLNGELQPPSE